jgi:D-threo-aldose 1-dehydrogenase
VEHPSGSTYQLFDSPQEMTRILTKKMRVRKTLLKGPLGFGAAPLGNMFRNIPDAEASATVEAAWEQGTRYFDTAPFYGAGLSEIRLGKVLSKYNRDDYVLSTKVGRIILDQIETGPRDFGEKGVLFAFGRPNKIAYDYSEKGTLRSIDDSLKRLGVDRIDFVWIHDVARDFFGDEWLARFELLGPELSGRSPDYARKERSRLGVLA